METAERLKSIEATVAQYYDKLGFFEHRFAVTSSLGERYQIQTEIKNEIAPMILKYEGEYARLLSENVSEHAISNETATHSLVVLQEAADQITPKLAENPKVGTALVKLRSTLADSRLSAAAKLKIALPIVPMLVSYELEVDTSGALMQLWRTLKSRIAPILQNPI